MKKLLSICALLVLLAGCQQQMLQPPAPSAGPTELTPWVDALATVMAYDQEQAEEAFKTFEKPLNDPMQLYRYGLVNQQLADRMGWIRARDSFRQLGALSLSEPVKVLVTLLEKYNQQMINADARNTRLIQAVAQSDEQLKSLNQQLESNQQSLDKLQQQLQALKAVEEAISHKRADPLQPSSQGE